jgi:putative ABC transport system ATP-binding protein
MIGVHLQSVTKRFQAADGEVAALDDLTLTIAPGDFVVIVGHNGSGKSTLLNIIAGRDRPDEGTVSTTEAGAPPRKRIAAHSAAVVVQDPARGTACDLTVEEHLLLARLPRVPRPFATAVRRGRATFAPLQLAEPSLRAKMKTEAIALSGGERQLLALEMAIARHAGLILLDEPTASLDRANAQRCFAYIQRMNLEHGATVILVTHDLVAATEAGERLLVLGEGRIQCDVSGSEKKALKATTLFSLTETVSRPG